MCLEENLYTFIVDYKGGTYISQVNAINIESACEIWLKSLDYNGMTKFGHKSYKKLCWLWENDEEKLVALQSTIHVWCFSYSIKKSLFLVNVIKTVQATDPNDKE